MRRADEEFVLGLFGASMPTTTSVQQKRQQLSADQQTASQFAGTEGKQSAASGQPRSQQHSNTRLTSVSA